MIQIMDRFMISLFYDAFARFLFAGWYQMNDYFPNFTICFMPTFCISKRKKVKKDKDKNPFFN